MVFINDCKIGMIMKTAVMTYSDTNAPCVNRQASWSAVLLSGLFSLCLCAGNVAAEEPASLEDTADSSSDPLTQAQRSFEHPVKYAIYSAAWYMNSNAGLQIIAHNEGDSAYRLEKVVFADESGSMSDTEIELDLEIPAHGWADTQLPYVDLLNGNECVSNTMDEDWKLVEISNYTLNPSVRGLIIEDTRSFRIFQCVRSVQSYWQDADSQDTVMRQQWLMYHFERLPIY
tara:strand:- start:4552 stop:5241 length:690 start_codon:yes stop_codon:yes gene_type:complete